MPQQSVREQLTSVSTRFSNLLERVGSPIARRSATGALRQLDGDMQENGLVALTFQGTSLTSGKMVLFSAMAANSEGPQQQCTSQQAADGQQPAADIVQQSEQLEAVMQQYHLKQQEVELLQAQVQRLCNYVDAAVTDSDGSSGRKVK